MFEEIFVLDKDIYVVSGKITEKSMDFKANSGYANNFNYDGAKESFRIQVRELTSNKNSKKECIGVVCC